MVSGLFSQRLKENLARKNLLATSKAKEMTPSKIFVLTTGGG